MINLFCIRPKGFNVGNDAIFIGLQNFVYKTFGEVVNLIVLPATSKYESQAKAGLTGKTIYEINQFGHGVIIGGGNLYENGELEVGLDALDTLEVPLMLFSLSRGRIYNHRYQLVNRTDAMPLRVIRGLHLSLIHIYCGGNHRQSLMPLYPSHLRRAKSARTRSGPGSGHIRSGYHPQERTKRGYRG